MPSLANGTWWLAGKEASTAQLGPGLSVTRWTSDMLCFAPPPLLQQSFNDKRKKNLFSRKFPFYKNKDQSEQETSDVDRKYVGGGRERER